MSQASVSVQPGPPQPARPRRTALLVVPVVVLLLLAIPGGAFAYAENQLSAGQRLQASGDFAGALNAYATVESVAGNPVSRVLLADTANKAEAAAAETHVSWGNQLQQQGKFADAEPQFEAAVSSGIADWQTRGNEALAGLYLAWGDSLLAQKKFDLAIDKYRGVAGFDTPGRLRQDTTAHLATAFAAYATSYVADKDWPNAVTWFKDLVKNYPESPEAKLALAGQLPDALYSGALAYVQLSRYQQARDAMTDVMTTYPHSSAAPKAAAAMAAPQPLTGMLETPDHQGVPNRLIRISTRWRIIRPGIYADYGTIYQTTTDRGGNFSLKVPPGKAYLVTWWDPARGTFVTTFVSDTVPVNQVTIDPLQPEHATVTTA